MLWYGKEQPVGHSSLRHPSTTYRAIRPSSQLQSPLVAEAYREVEPGTPTQNPQGQSSCARSKFQQSHRGQSHNPATQPKESGAEWGVRTLRQACCQEIPGSAMCVQNFNDSRGLAIRITYRISLRSSSLWEPRHPLLKVVMSLVFQGAAEGCGNPHSRFRYSGKVCFC